MLLDKIKNVLKEETTHPNLIILILFSIRIMILRLKKETLNGMFKTIWSSVLFLLEKIFNSKKLEKKSEQCNIVLAGFKLLELISCSDIDEFNLHRWAFMYEYFSIQLKQGNDRQHTERSTPFLINPYLLAHTPPGTKVELVTGKLAEVCIGTKRKLLFMENKMEKERLESKVLEFLTYVTILANTVVELDVEELETLIQGDFIDFANFIALS